MNTKNILKTLALAMLLVSACNKSEIANDENTEKKGFALPVTVNVTREGDDATKVTYNDGTKKLAFTAGDKLLVRGNDNSDGGAGSFAGMLDYDASEGKFSGTIYTQNSYSGTADALFTAANSNWVGAALFPNGYETYAFLSISGSGYGTSYSMSYNKAIAATKAAAVEQFSLESAKTYSSGFALSPENAIFNFTIIGLTDGAKDVTLKDGTRTMFTGSVTPSSGTAAFALGARIKDNNDWSVNLKNVTLTIDGTDIDITSTSKNLEAGHIYNVKRAVGALPGKFTISNDGGTTTSQVFFSKGNLQAAFASAGSSCTWQFATNQWDYIGSAAANTSINGSGSVSLAGTVDLFGWVGTSSDNNNYGIWNNTTANDYGNTKNESLKNDWGHHAITNGGNTADMWRTLTREEWAYMLSTRSGATVNGSNNVRFAKATIRTDATGVKGLLLFPDGVTFDASEASWGKLNDGYENYTTRCTAAQWTALEAKGCVFLPAAGNRTGTTVSDAGNAGAYWTATGSDNKDYSYRVSFGQTSWSDPQYGAQQQKTYGHSVRLVRDVE